MNDPQRAREESLATAAKALESGEPDRADAICRQLLESDPANAEVLNLAGLIAHRRGRAEEAAGYLRRATEADGSQASFHYNLGVACQTLGRLAEAVDSYRRAIELEPASIDPHNNLGYALLQLGRIEEAVCSLERAVARRGDFAEAHNNLGLALVARGDGDRAVASFRRAIKHKPDLAQAHFNLGLALAGLGKLNEAAARYRQAIDLVGNYAEAQLHLGILFKQLGRFAEAAEVLGPLQAARPDDAALANELAGVYAGLERLEDSVACYRRALSLKPDNAAYHNNLGHGLTLLGKTDEAVEAFHRALELSPDLAETHNNLGKIWLEQQRREDAAKAFERALEIDPRHAAALCNLGTVLKEQRRFDEAIKHYQESLRCQAGQAAVHVNLGNAYTEQNRFAEAIESYRAAVLIEPTDAVTHSNLANALTLSGRPDEAESECRLAMRLKQDYAEAHHNRSLALLALGRVDEALVSDEHALRWLPDFPEARFTRALTWLLQGKYEQGWEDYEWRWEQKKITRPKFSQPVWDGSPLAGRTILLYAEQGLGDTLQFIRYAPLVRQCGGRVVVQCQKALAALLGRMAGIDLLVQVGDPLPHFDVHLPLLSAPRVLRTTVDSIPDHVPYVFPDPELVERWQEELGSFADLKIGIAWQGNPVYGGDRLRSIPLRHFAALARAADTRFFSLQKGHGREQLPGLGGRLEVTDLADRLDETGGAFMDTAAVIRNLDLVITSDTAIAHLAGALAAPTWLALPLGPDWRWLEGGDDSPWYPSMRLFRQRRLNDWDDVFEHIAAALVELAQASPRGKTSGGRTRRRAPRRGKSGATIAGEDETGPQQVASMGIVTHQGAPASQTVVVPSATDSNPRISVVVPCYNGSSYLSGCLESVTAQNADCEVIFVDDGSTDDSVDRAMALMRNRSAAMFVVQQPNQGPAAARNTGLRMARGKYVCFLDVDDRFLPGFLTAASTRLDANPSLVAASCRIELVGAHRPVEPWHLRIIENTLPGNLLARTDVVARIGGFPCHPAFRGPAAGEDFAFRQALSREGPVAVIDEPLFEYRVQRGSHFDFFLDRATFDDGQVQFKYLSEEEINGSLQQAVNEYEQAIQTRAAARLDGQRADGGSKVHESHE